MCALYSFAVKQTVTHSLPGENSYLSDLMLSPINTPVFLKLSLNPSWEKHGLKAWKTKL